MTKFDPVREVIRARFAHDELRFLSDVAAFTFPVPDAGKVLEGKQLSIYHPAFDAVVCRSRKHGLILAQNTYLVSFAYNASAVWLKYGHQHDSLASGEETALRRLMRYNLKKFYAEQIIRRTRSVFGVAIFLETLLYEQWEMQDVLEGPDVSDADKNKLKTIASLMSSLVLFHEAGHIFSDYIPNFRHELRDEIKKSLPGLSDEITDSWNRFKEKEQIEFECDALAALWLANEKIENLSFVCKLRLIVLGFAFFSAMHSLDRSAAETARTYPASNDIDTRDDILGSLPGAEYVIGTDLFMRERAQSVLKLAEGLAERQGVGLYGVDDEPALPPTIMNLLNDFVPEIISGSHPRYRGMCEMVARALQGHKEAIDYLVWRSKKYTLPN